MVNLPDGHVSDYNGEATPPAIPSIDAGRGASPLSALQPDQQEEIDEAQHQLEQESAEVKRQLEHHRDDGRARNRVREVNR